jgi:predicted ferric reductase
MTNQIWWFLARSTGIVAWALSSLAVIWGLLLSTRLVTRRGAPKWILDLHRFLGGIAVVFLGLHIASVVADTFVHFGRVDVLVPFASKWKPLPVGLGVLAMYVMVAVEATSLAMKHLPRKLWRRIHMSSFGAYVLTTAHGFTAGTDHRNVALFGAYAASAVTVVFLMVFRILTAKKDASSPRRQTPRVASSDDGTRPHKPSDGHPVRQRRPQPVP